MKLNAAILMVLFFALSGFTWGSSDESKAAASNDSYNSSSSSMKKSKAKKKSSSSMANASAVAQSAPSSYAPASSGSQRANAVRILTAGDEATRKARMDSLSRLAKSLAAAKQAKEGQAASVQESYQY